MKLPFPKEHKVYVAAHRGNSDHYWENTMTAFRSAIEAGADMVETDVHLTKDDVPVLIHDDTVDRTTDGHGRVADYTYAELCRLNAGDPYGFEPIPRLEELLELLSGTDVLLNLEFKEYDRDGNRARCEKCIRLAVELCEKYHMTDKMVFNSFDYHVLHYIHEHYGPGFRLHGFYPYDKMFNVEGDPGDILFCACLPYGKDTSMFDDLPRRGIEMWMPTRTRMQNMLKFYAEHGCTLITTNNVPDAIAKLEALGYR